MQTNWFQHLSCLDRVFKPQFEYKLSFGWRTGSYFRNGLPQEHFEDKCFLPLPNIYANSSMGEFKSREEKALGKVGGGDWRYWWENCTTIIPAWSLAYLISSFLSTLLSNQPTSLRNLFSTLSPTLFLVFLHLHCLSILM